MDWIEEQITNWKRKLKNFSLRKAMMVYLVSAIFLVMLAGTVTIRFCAGWRNLILATNTMNDSYRYIGDGIFAQKEITSQDDALFWEETDVVTVGKKDRYLWEFLTFIQVFCIPGYSVAAVLLVSSVYYKNRIKEPLFLLKTEMEAVKRNDLSFSCFYDSADELGDICQTMDTMRKAVVDNQKNMWELMEEQRKINAAFAHDLRTPLTVISGYVDMLMEYYPKGELSGEKLMEALTSIKGQTTRMKSFSETMKKLDSFELLEVKKKKYQTKDLKDEIISFAKGMENKQTPGIFVTTQFCKDEIYCDENIILEVLGNLLSNALRYGKEKIEILAQQEGDRFFLYVKDDGRGMTKEELYKADSPYYSDKNYGEEKKEGQSVHFGLGLTICRILCKKHGGRLGFTNSVEHGAIVCADFYVG